MIYSSALTRRRVRSISCASICADFSSSASLTRSSAMADSSRTAASSSPEVNATPYGISCAPSPTAAGENVGTMTLIRFFVETDSSVERVGRISASRMARGLVSALAVANERWTRASSSSTFSRMALSSRTMSRKRRISSSHLSLSSLWPRRAVASLFLRFFSSMRVGFTLSSAILSCPFGKFAWGAPLCKGRLGCGGRQTAPYGVCVS